MANAEFSTLSTRAVLLVVRFVSSLITGLYTRLTNEAKKEQTQH